MVKNQEDLRIVKTKKAIEDAFFDLLEKMPFEKFTVKDICQAAMVGNATFYYHYSDKYDLAEQLVRKYLAELRSAMLWQLSMLEDGMPDREAWKRIAEVKTGLSAKRRLLLKIQSDVFDFHSELFSMFQELIRLRRPNENMPEEEYAQQVRIAARQLIDYFSYVEDMDDYMPLMDYLEKGRGMLSGFIEGERAVSVDEE